MTGWDRSHGDPSHPRWTRVGPRQRYDADGKLVEAAIVALARRAWWAKVDALRLRDGWKVKGLRLTDWYAVERWPEWWPVAQWVEIGNVSATARSPLCAGRTDVALAVFSPLSSGSVSLAPPWEEISAALARRPKLWVPPVFEPERDWPPPWLAEALDRALPAPRSTGHELPAVAPRATIHELSDRRRPRPLLPPPSPSPHSLKGHTA